MTLTFPSERNRSDPPKGSNARFRAAVLRSKSKAPAKREMRARDAHLLKYSHAASANKRTVMIQRDELFILVFLAMDCILSQDCLVQHHGYGTLQSNFSKTDQPGSRLKQ